METSTSNVSNHNQLVMLKKQRWLSGKVYFCRQDNEIKLTHYLTTTENPAVDLCKITCLDVLGFCRQHGGRFMKMAGSKKLALTICPQTQTPHPSLKTARRTRRAPLHPPCLHAQTPPHPPLLSRPSRPPTAPSFPTFLQTPHKQTAATRPAVRHQTLILREAPQQEERRQQRGKRLKRPKTTKSLFTVWPAKWRSTPTPSWSLTAAVFTSTFTACKACVKLTTRGPNPAPYNYLCGPLDFRKLHKKNLQDYSCALKVFIWIKTLILPN